MPALFSRSTLLEACNLLAGCFTYHGEVEDLFYRWGLDDFAEKSAGSTIQRFRQVFRLLKDEPEKMYDGDTSSTWWWSAPRCVSAGAMARPSFERWSAMDLPWSEASSGEHCRTYWTCQRRMTKSTCSWNGMG